jgi:hypothetical protein
VSETPVKSGHAGPSKTPDAPEGIDTVPAEPETVEQPKHPTAQMTTFELREYRRQLEGAIAWFDRRAPVPPARNRLQARLDDVIAEQDERARIAASA